MRKRILILTSKGGHGHIMASELLKMILKDYEVITIKPFEELVQKIDLVRRFSFNYYDYEQLHNFLAQRGWIRTINFIVKIFARLRYIQCRSFMENKLYEFLKKKTRSVTFTSNSS